MKTRKEVLEAAYDAAMRGDGEAAQALVFLAEEMRFDPAEPEFGPLGAAILCGGAWAQSDQATDGNAIPAGEVWMASADPVAEAARKGGAHSTFVAMAAFGLGFDLARRGLARHAAESTARPDVG